MSTKYKKIQPRLTIVGTVPGEQDLVTVKGLQAITSADVVVYDTQNTGLLKYAPAGAKKQMKMGGGIVTFNIKGGVERGRRFLDALQVASLTANLGDTRTIATHPASTTHAKLTEEERLATGITPGLVRISVGLEHIDDIINDVMQALERSK